jgi:hypothetical protein
MTEGPSINVDEFRHRPVNEIAAILPNKEAVKARQSKEPPRLLGGSLDLCLLAPVLDLLRSRSWASTNGADRASVGRPLARLSRRLDGAPLVSAVLTDASAFRQSNRVPRSRGTRVRRRPCGGPAQLRCRAW